MNQSLSENIEIKARVANANSTREKAMALATEEPFRLHQTDTYFHGAKGRLKLREIRQLSGSNPANNGKLESQLIWYDRADEDGPKSSHYQISPVADPTSLKSTLQNAYGVSAIVVKQREVIMHENVRIHLDRVDGLGDFLELEAVQSVGMQLDEQLALVQSLCERLGINALDRISGSYRELVLRQH